jgi:HD-like signal output (HDOD) protein/ActR/RegA family two-component response regulator
MNDSAVEPLTGNILFMDDEANILKSLQREFVDTDYEIFLAQSAEDSMKVLGKESIDILVSDSKMPGIDGLEFLKLVRRQYPATYRVILSGSVEPHVVLKALSSGLASAYIPKPWEADVFYKKINHLFLTRRALKNREIFEIINSIGDLPALPAVYNEFAQAVEEERPYDELALIITRDVASTTKLLHIASSAYYNLDENLSVKRALTYIGISAIKQILLFTSLAGDIKLESVQIEHLRNISMHSVLVNYSMSELYRIKFQKDLPERYTSIGITHDIGKIIMLGHLTNRYNAVIAYMKNHPDADFYQSELSLGFEGTTHAEIGAFFLDLWGLPGSSIEACLYHHNTLKDHQKSDQDIFEACRTANLLSNYIVSLPDAAYEEPPPFLEGYNKDKIYNLIAHLRKKRETQEEL